MVWRDASSHCRGRRRVGGWLVIGAGCLSTRCAWAGSAQVQASSLLHELRHWDDASPLAIESTFETLLDEAGIDARLDHAAGPAWLARVRERLADDCLDAPDIVTLAQICDVHPVYLARAFRARYGCSPAEYLRRCRLERALLMLHGPDRTLTEIAAACGYADHSHFGHAFRGRYRCTPSQYRARWLADR